MPRLESRLRDAIGDLDTDFAIGDLRRSAARRRARSRATRAGSVVALLALIISGFWFGFGRTAVDRLTSRNAGVFPDRTKTVLIFDDSDMSFTQGDTSYGAAAIVDLDHRVIERRLMKGLAPGDETYGMGALGRSVVTYGSAVWAHPLDGGASRRLDGNGSLWIPSADQPNTVWTLRYERYAYTGTPTVQQVDEREHVLRRGIGMNEGAGAMQHPVAGIGGLIVYEPQNAPGFLLWNPLTRRVTGSIPTGANRYFLGAIGDELAWCDGDCSTMHLHAVGSGRNRVIRTPRGLIFEFDGPNATQFSIDGRWIATMAGERRADGRIVADAVVVIDRRTGRAKTVYRFTPRLPEGCHESEINMPGCTFQTVAFPTWSPDSRRVFFVVIKPKQVAHVTVGEYVVDADNVHFADLPLTDVARSLAVRRADATALLSAAAPFGDERTCTKAMVQATRKPCGFRF